MVEAAAAVLAVPADREGLDLEPQAGGRGHGNGGTAVDQVGAGRNGGTAAISRPVAFGGSCGGSWSSSVAKPSHESPCPPGTDKKCARRAFSSGETVSHPREQRLKTDIQNLLCLPSPRSVFFVDETRWDVARRHGRRGLQRWKRGRGGSGERDIALWSWMRVFCLHLGWP